MSRILHPVSSIIHIYGKLVYHTSPKASGRGLWQPCRGSARRLRASLGRFLLKKLLKVDDASDDKRTIFFLQKDKVFIDNTIRSVGYFHPWAVFR